MRKYIHDCRDTHVLLVLALTLCLCANAGSLDYATSWEPNEPNIQEWPTLIRNWDCPCPVASFLLGSAAAARTGRAGVTATVSAGSNEAWHVQLQSPVLQLEHDKLYSACLWVRMSASSAVTPSGSSPLEVSLSLLRAADYEFTTWDTTKLTAEWRRLCIHDVRPSRPPNGSSPSSTATGYYFAVDLATLPPGTAIDLDDFAVTSRPDTIADDEAYAAAPAVAARIEAHRKGNFRIRFTDAASGQPLARTRLRPFKLRLAQHDFPFGTAMEWDGVPKDRLDWYLGTVKKHYNALVPEYSFKWPDYEPVQGQFPRLDYLMQNHVSFATANGFVMTRGHALEWPTAAWGFPDHWSRQGGCDAYSVYLRSRITRDVGQFKGKFTTYDVFNEVVNELQFIEDCPGMWPGILHDAFRWAAAADPTAMLCLNDYGLITADKWRDMVDLVQGMLAERVPIHCIGVQSYLSTGPDRPTPAFMRPRLDALAALNLTLLITEFNFFSRWDQEADEPVWEGSDEEHAALYDEYIRFWMSVPYIKGMLMWGFWDTSNWIRNGGVYRADGSPKASAKSLLKLWSAEWNTTLTKKKGVALSAAGEFPFRGFYGKYDYQVTLPGGRRRSGTVGFPASAGSSQTVTVALR